MQHWQIRQQQRGIPGAALDLLFEYGETIHDGHGAEILYFTKRARQQVLRDRRDRELKGYDRWSELYVVLGSGGIATVGHRFRRMNRQ